MNAKTFGMLAALAVILAALAVISQNTGGGPGSIAADAAGDPLLPGLLAELEAVDTITLTGAGGAELVTLERDDGGTWTVAEQDGYPADFTKIRALLLALGEAVVVEEKTADPAFHSRLGVEAVSEPEAAGLAVTLSTDAGGGHSIVLGHPYGGDARYARLADGNQSYLIDQNPELPRAAAEWVVPDLLEIASARVQRVEIEHGDGQRLVIAKAGRDDTNFAVEDLPEGRELAYASVANVTANALRDLDLDAVARAPAEPAEPDVVVEFWTFDGLVVTARAIVPADEEGEASDGSEASDEREASDDAASEAGDPAPWISFTARFEPEQAEAFAPAESDAETDAETDAESDAETDAPAAADVEAEAAAINDRLAGWRFRIPSYQYDQMTRRIEDLLAPAE